MPTTAVSLAPRAVAQEKPKTFRLCRLRVELFVELNQRPETGSLGDGRRDRAGGDEIDKARIPAAVVFRMYENVARLSIAVQKAAIVGRGEERSRRINKRFRDGEALTGRCSANPISPRVKKRSRTRQLFRDEDRSRTPSASSACRQRAHGWNAPSIGPPACRPPSPGSAAINDADPSSDVFPR